MGSSKGNPQDGADVLRRSRDAQQPLPAELAKVLPENTAQAWQTLRAILPDELYLVGGTAVAVHLGHRKSRDLDFFYHEGKVDLESLSRELGKLPEFAVVHTAPETLQGTLSGAKVEFFHADEEKPQHTLEPPETVAGLPVASLKDLAALKLKVIGDRAEMRDYFDLKLIEEEGGITVESALAYFLARHDADPRGNALWNIVYALGSLDEVEEDESLPIGKEELAAWWRKRQVELVLHLDNTPLDVG
jgi:Nucleotidyl transferase AbiEii toxin, Type IV TA system